jgi:hypothetical protein
VVSELLGRLPAQDLDPEGQNDCRGDDELPALRLDRGAPPDEQREQGGRAAECELGSGEVRRKPLSRVSRSHRRAGDPDGHEEDNAEAQEGETAVTKLRCEDVPRVSGRPFDGLRGRDLVDDDGSGDAPDDEHE